MRHCDDGSDDCALSDRIFGFEDESLKPSPALLARARAHVARCERCDASFGADLRMASAHSAVPPIPARTTLAPPRRAHRRTVAAALALALVAAAVVIAATLGTNVRGPSPAPLVRSSPVAAESVSTPVPFALPPDTRFRKTVAVIRLDRGRPSILSETEVYCPAMAGELGGSLK